MTKIKSVDKKKFEAWANKKLREIQEVLLMTHFRLDPITQSKEDDTSFS